MALPTSYPLKTGDSIPAIGLGTWQSKPNEVKEAVCTALKAGNRHIDAAAVYGNEKEVGEGIKLSGVPREEIFVWGPSQFLLTALTAIARSPVNYGTHTTNPNTSRGRSIKHSAISKSTISIST